MARDEQLEASILDGTLTGSLTSNAAYIHLSGLVNTQLTELNLPGLTSFTSYLPSTLTSLNIPGVTSINKTASCPNLSATFNSVTSLTSNFTTAYAYYPNLTALNTLNACVTASHVHTGNKLTSVTGGQIGSSNQTNEIYLHYSDSDPVNFSPITNLLITGNTGGSKSYTATNNIYTDSSTIRNALVAYVEDYTTINVYHLDGSAW